MAAGLLTLLALPFVANAYVVGIGLTLLMWLALTQSWCVLSGMTGYVSLGHVVFYGLGAYLMVVTWQQLPLPLAVLAAGALAAAFAALVGLPVLRVRGPYFVILTFGVAELVKYSIMAIEAASGTASRMLFGAPDLIVIYFAMFALAVASALLLRGVGASRFGHGLRSLRENEEAAETLGVPVVRYKLHRLRAVGGDPRHGGRGDGAALDLLRRRPGVRPDDLRHGDRDGDDRRRRQRPGAVAGRRCSLRCCPSCCGRMRRCCT